MTGQRCSGAMSVQHDPAAPVATYRIGIGRDAVLCQPCADAAGRLGMLDRRGPDREPSWPDRDDPHIDYAGGGDSY